MRALARGAAGLTALVLLAIATLLGAQPASAASATPYSDPKVKGFIAFCDSHGRPITSGSIRDLPFAATAISSEPVPAGYAVKNGKATLYAFQPRQGVDPGDWSSQPLTGSSLYDNAKHPMASITTADKPLEQILQAYPARWDGLLQLRMFYSAPNMQPYTIQYPATDIRITGETWRAVGAESVPCNVGKAVSIETLLLAPSAFPSPSKAIPAPAGPASMGGPTDSPGAVAVADGAGVGVPDVGADSSSTELVGLLSVAALGVVAGSVLWRRQRLRRAP